MKDAATQSIEPEVLQMKSNGLSPFKKAIIKNLKLILHGSILFMLAYVTGPTSLNLQ